MGGGHSGAIATPFSSMVSPPPLDLQFSVCVMRSLLSVLCGGFSLVMCRFGSVLCAVFGLSYVQSLVCVCVVFSL